MARIRSVHPGQWTDDEFVSCSPLTRLLVIGLRNEADDNGVFEWNPVKLKMRLLPADNCDVSVLLSEASEKNQIKHFSMNNKSYGIIRNFERYQRPKYPTFLYPVPEVIPEGYTLHKLYSRNIPEGLQKSQSRGREEESREELPCVVMDGFSRFWAAYPKKKSKGDAEKAWKKIKPNEQLQDRISRALEQAKTSADWKKEDGQFIPYPASWLNAKGWEDEVVPQRRSSEFAGGV